MEQLIAALPSIFSGIILLIVGWAATQVQTVLKNFKGEHSELLNFKKSQEKDFEEFKKSITEEFKEYQQNHSKEFEEFKISIKATLEEIQDTQSIFNDSQRTQIKASIVDIYQNAQASGYITPMELDIINKLFKSYADLNGNTYIEAIVNRCNCEIPIKGEALPNY